MTNYVDTRDLAEEAADPEIDNDSWIYIHRLAQEIDSSVPDDGAGPVPQETIDAVVDALQKFGDEHGPLVPEEDFEEHAQQVAESIGAIEDAGRWPACHIDWKEAADSLRMDYTSIEYHGETYLYR